MLKHIYFVYNIGGNKEVDIFKVVIKIGGHILSSDLAGTICSYTKVLERLHDEGHRLAVVVGGGEEARKYIKAAKELGASEFACDLLGIEVSRLNARLLIIALHDYAHPTPPETLPELQIAFQRDRIIVMGGLEPGQSTNAVAALAAEAVGANLLVNATNVDGVYTSDPKRDPKAKKLDEIGTNELLKLVLGNRMVAGSYALFDPMAIKIVERSKILTRIIDGRIPENIEKTVRGEPIGTLLKSSGS